MGIYVGEAPARMAEVYAHITATHEEAFPGRTITKWEWQGEAHLPVRVARYHMRSFGYGDFPSEIHSLFPWPLRLLRRDEWTKDAVYIRMDVRGSGLRYAWYKASHVFSEYAAMVYARCIFTLMVWNLADVPHGEYASWRHIGKRRRNK